jgi:hypothetical protein
MNLFVPVLCALGALALAPLKERDGRERPKIPHADQAVLYLALAANAIFFSVIGGALLTRYLLPLYPLVLLLCVATLRRRVRYWWWLIGLSCAAFALGLFINPPYKFAPEDNLNYADVIRLHQSAIRQITAHFPGQTVLTAWPGTDELTKPELGYVHKPVPVISIENFSQPEIQKVAADRKQYGVAFVFSQKYDPPRISRLQAFNEAMDKRFFDFHRSLSPQTIAQILQGRTFWSSSHAGQWAAVLDFGRAATAKSASP